MPLFPTIPTDIRKRRFMGGFQNSVRGVPIVLAFAVIGWFGLHVSHAATFATSTEAEAGAVAGTASMLTEAGASGAANNVVAFGQPSVPGTPVTSFGARCDGATDDTAAIQQGINNVPAGTALQIPAGKTCVYTDDLQANRAGVHITGPGILLSKNTGRSAIHITAANVTVDNLTMYGTAPSRVDGVSDAAGVFIEHASGATIRNVTFQGQTAALGMGTNGIFNDGGSNFTFDHVTVTNSKADCIHNTNQANTGTISYAVVSGCGDDGIAVVSYRKDNGECHDITIESPKLYGQYWGRGFTVVGGSNITYKNIYAENSFGAAIYAGAEGNNYNTYGITNVKYLGGTLKGSNQGADHLGNAEGGGQAPGPVQGAIQVLNYMNPGTNVNSDVTISDMTITGTDPAAGTEVRIEGSPNNRIQFLNMNLTTTHQPFDAGGDEPAQYNTIGWIVNGNPIADHKGFTP